MNNFARNIGIWYYDRKWAEVLFEKILDSYPGYCLFRIYRNQLKIILTDGTSIRFFNVNCTSRSMALTESYIQKGIDYNLFCDDWQSKVIDELNAFSLDDLMIFNPRRKHFDVSDKNASQKQIEWEFKYLNSMDIFTMYFTNSENSVQPICLYELGRHLERMIHRFPGDWKDRIIIGIENGYSRTQDVIIQSRLALRYNVVQERITPEVYAQMMLAMAVNAPIHLEKEVISLNNKEHMQYLPPAGLNSNPTEAAWAY